MRSTKYSCSSGSASVVASANPVMGAGGGLKSCSKGVVERVLIDLEAALVSEVADYLDESGVGMAAFASCQVENPLRQTGVAARGVDALLERHWRAAFQRSCLP